MFSRSFSPSDSFIGVNRVVLGSLETKAVRIYFLWFQLNNTSMCARHKICRKYEITVSDRLGLMEQSDLDTSVNQKRLIHHKDTETSRDSQDTITSRSACFQTAEYHQRCTLVDDV